MPRADFRKSFAGAEFLEIFLRSAKIQILSLKISKITRKIRHAMTALF